MLAPDKRPNLPASLGPAIWRGIKGQCPRCAEAGLFRAFLKPITHCPACRQDWTHQRADDFPPYISIFITGHLMAGPIIWFGTQSPLPLWAALAICLSMAAVLMIALLQPAKGGTIALQWWHGMHGFVPSGKDEVQGPAASSSGSPNQ
ncbi:MAG: DUF983 domain-containing protein [Novosphingobium sp.]|uniref:DUF983 domain-containing protein n=1 Tax=Novosphingobium sp. TaxID=1874826 RepID=UPI0032BC19DC